jgi:membrane protease YdiL (CAAX protease family)
MHMKKPIRNLIIFAVVALGCGFLGMLLDRLVPAEDPMKGLGVLLWLVAPLAVNLLLRALGRDGWKDLGLRPHFKDGWVWYLAALLIAPLVVLVTLGLGRVFGVVSLSGFAAMGFGALLPLMAAAFGGAVVKNIFEEFAWRGYLTPRFEAIKLHPFLNSLLTGLIWAGWHIPYYLYFLDRAELRAHTSTSLPVFIILAFLILPFHALVYGELRLLSKSVWPVWLLHTVANAVTLPLLSAGFVTLRAGFPTALLSPGTEGIIHSLLMGLVGLGLYIYRRRHTV